LLMRDFQLADVDNVVEILNLKGLHSFPEVDEPGAMERVEGCSAVQFLVCEVGGKVVGVLRGNYDG